MNQLRFFRIHLRHRFRKKPTVRIRDQVRQGKFRQVSSSSVQDGLALCVPANQDSVQSLESDENVLEKAICHLKDLKVKKPKLTKSLVHISVRNKLENQFDPWT